MYAPNGSPILFDNHINFDEKHTNFANIWYRNSPPKSSYDSKIDVFKFPVELAPSLDALGRRSPENSFDIHYRQWIIMCMPAK